MHSAEIELDTVATNAETMAHMLRHAASLPDGEREALKDLARRIVDQTAEQMVFQGVPPEEARQLAVIVLGSLACMPLVREFGFGD